jgi:hypothetical protein
MRRLCEVLEPLLGPRISVAVHGSAWVVVQLDQGYGGSTGFRAAPWFPGSDRAEAPRTDSAERCGGGSQLGV